MRTRQRVAFSGHVWTLGPFLRSVIQPTTPPPSRHFRTHALDPDLGRVQLTGRLRATGRPRLLVVVHGLGGSVNSFYARHAATAAEAADLDCLRLNLRGADRSGADFYHAGLTDDLVAALSAPDLASYEELHVLGFSLGGHVSLRYAAEAPDPRLNTVAAVCPPIDLEPGVRHIDDARGAFYRKHVLKGLKEIYREVAARNYRPLPCPVDQAMRIRTIRQWDEEVVAPRHGFTSAEDYYAQTSVGPRLPKVSVPALVVATEHDPMVPARTLRPWLDAARNIRTIWLEEGGHVGFPQTVDLGLGAPGSVEEQVVHWMSQAVG